MKTLKELGNEAQAIIKELEVIDTKITELSAGNDAAALKTAKDVYAEKEQAFKAVEQEIEKAKELERKKAFALSVSQTLAPVTTAEKAAPRVETTKDSDAKEYLNIFTKFLKYERLDDNARNAMLPKSDSFQNKGSMEIAVAPQLIKQVLLGNHVTKSMGTGGVVTNTTGSNLVDREFLAELMMEAMPTPQVIDRVRIIPTKSGDVEIPILVQTDGSGKFGGLTFSRIQEGATSLTQTQRGQKLESRPMNLLDQCRCPNGCFLVQ
jgi:HK97 family phage major capsid protein